MSFPSVAICFTVLLSFLTLPADGQVPSSPESFKRASAPAPGSILGDSLLQRRADEGLRALYNMEYARADSIFKVIGARFPGHPIEPFLRSLVVWWEILPTLTVKDTSHDDAFFDLMRDVIRRCDRMLKVDNDDFDARFFKGAAHGFRGRLLSDREQWLRAAQDGRHALDYIFDIAEADTTNPDMLFGVGVYDYFAEAVPEEYPIVRPVMLFFPDGNKERGIDRLERVAEEGRFISAEAAYFLLQIHLIFEPDYEQSLRWVNTLRKAYPGNALFHLFEGRVYFRWGQFDTADGIFRDVIRKADEGAKGYVAPIVSQAHYYAGREAFRRGRTSDALVHFNRVVELERPWHYESWFRVNALLRAGMVFDLQGKRQQAESAYRNVLEMEDRGDSREDARRYLKTPYGSTRR